jgi:signal transduction histidine kinase
MTTAALQRRRSAAAALPAALALVLAALLAAGLLSLWLAPAAAQWQWQVIWELVVGGGFAAAAVAMVRHDRSSVPGRLFALLAVLLLAGPLVRAAGAARAADVLLVLATAVVAPLALLRVVPHGRAAPALRGVEAAIGVSGAVAVAATAVAADVVGWSAGFMTGVLAFCAGWLLFEQSDGDERRQVLWLVLGVCTGIPVAALFFFVSDSTPVGETALALAVAVVSLLFPLSAGVAVIAPRALDVRAVIRQAVVLAVMTSLVVAVWAGAEAVLDIWAGDATVPGFRGLLAVVIAAGFHPVLVQVRGLVDELLFGGRADPVDTLTRLGTHLAAGSSPQDWLDTLRAALAVPGIELRSGTEVVAASGTVDAARAEVTDLVTGDEHVGDLVVALPRDELRLAPTTRAVLGLVAPPLAQALRAARLGEELRESRRRVVSALEEERRRVRRDLHDGLGPTLTGIAYSADAAANLVAADADAAVRLLRELRADAGEAIAEVRRIVYGLRPKALDELGLVGAVRQRVEHLHATGGRALAVDVEAPASLPELSAAVEVAAYRVAVEAVTNVARHAGVDRAQVTFALVEAGRLLVRVTDAGSSAEPWRPGVGLAAMRERVEGVGGVLTVTSGPDGGVVTASLPLGQGSDSTGTPSLGENGV